MMVAANSNWFTALVRTLPAVAMASLAGGAIGGFSVYAVNLALTEPPAQRAQAMVSPPPPPAVAGQQQTAVPAPQPLAVPVQQQPAAPLQQQIAAPVQQQAAGPQTSWPDALSRSHRAAAAAPATPPSVSTVAPSAVSALPAQAATSHIERDSAAAPEWAQSVSTTQFKSAANKLPARKPRTVARHPLHGTDQSAGETASRSEPVYDYYGGADRRGYNGDADRGDDAGPVPRGAMPPRRDASRWRDDRTTQPGGTRVLVRRQTRDSDDREPRDVAPALPPQPPAPFGGLFGGGARYDDFR